MKRQNGIGFLLMVLAGAAGGLMAQDAAKNDPALAALVRLLSEPGATELHRDVLVGMEAGLADRRNLSMPVDWPKAYQNLARSEDTQVRDLSLKMALKFGDPAALKSLRSQLADPARPIEARKRALAALLERRDEELGPMLLKLLDEPELRREAIRGLAAYELAEVPGELLKRYAGLDAATRQDAVQTLAARPVWASSLIGEVEAGRIAPSELSAFAVRQMLGFNDSSLSDRIRKAWGDIREANKDKTELAAKFKRTLTPKALTEADLSKGRAIYQRTCLACHKMFGEGGAIGPELTGSNRNNLDYILENVLDPSAAVARDYQMVVIQTTDSRVISGMIRRETDRGLVIQTLNEEIILPIAEVQSRQVVPVSMMPEGLFQVLKPKEVIDLVAYLASPNQVPLPKP